MACGPTFGPRRHRLFSKLAIQISCVDNLSNKQSASHLVCQPVTQTFYALSCLPEAVSLITETLTVSYTRSPNRYEGMFHHTVVSTATQDCTGVSCLALQQWNQAAGCCIYDPRNVSGGWSVSEWIITANNTRSSLNRDDEFNLPVDTTENLIKDWNPFEILKVPLVYNL